MFTGCSSGNRAKYIFLFIGDGMGNSHVSAAESYLSYKEGKTGGDRLTFTGFPESGFCTTYSYDHQITGSSAAATAFTTGTKTRNGYLGEDPEGRPLENFTAKLKDSGYKIGIITSVPINNATPAAFYAHDRNRYDYYRITKQLPASGFEFFAGDGFSDFNGKDKKQLNTTDYLEKNGYAVCYGKKEFSDKMKYADKIILCQEADRDSSMSDYEIKREKSDMDLSCLLESGIEFLGDEKPFFIMCEGGEIDWAAHENHTMDVVDAVLRFDKAVQKAYEFYLKHKKETLIIVTADHETGGLTLGFGKTWGYPKLDWGDLETEWEKEGRRDTLDYESNKKLNEENGIGWTTLSHTGAMVPVFSIGKGAERFKGMFDNTDIPAKLLAK
jgi:alkaline phosphatase